MTGRAWWRVERKEGGTKALGRRFITFGAFRLWPGNTVCGALDMWPTAALALAADPAAVRAYEVKDDSDPDLPGHARLLVVRSVER